MEEINSLEGVEYIEEDIQEDNRDKSVIIPSSFNPNPDNPKDFDFKALREANGMKQADVAELIGVTVGYYKKIECKYVGLTAPLADKLSELYQIEIKPYSLGKFVSDSEAKVKKIDALPPMPSKKLDLIVDSPNKALNIALKKKHAKAAQKLMWLYQMIAQVRTIVDDVFLKGGDD